MQHASELTATDAMPSTVTINRNLLTDAVEKTIRPLIEDGILEDDREGYQHRKVLAQTVPLLEKEAIEANPVQSVDQAIAASNNLLSQFEAMKARDFLKSVDADELESHLIDLLYGTNDLESRLRSFLKWSELRDGPDGKQIGFNATTVSYLLAASQPTRFAFCKPMIYKHAAKALLGSDEVPSDSVERLLHANNFYKHVLEILRDEHSLPFTDLMHVHIAFYVMSGAYDDYPDWNTLMAENSTGDVDEVAVQSRDLNVILYGPPGTGKTYDTIARAVAICDGSAPIARDETNERFRLLRSEGRIEVVTFHQSYAYEDFVEGIRPVVIRDDETESGQNSEVRFECRDGIFKKICSVARSKISKQQSEPGSDLAKTPIWKMSLGDINNPEEATIYDDCVDNNYIRMGYGGGLNFEGCDDRDAIAAMLESNFPDIDPNAFAIQAMDAFKNKMSIGDLVVISAGNQKFRAIARVTGDYEHVKESRLQIRPVEWLAVFEESLAHETIYNKGFSQMCIYRLGKKAIKFDALRELLTGKPTGARNHVLIIDEINRGNIAKILGELITLLEPDKRLGAANELRLTLPNSGELFGIPKNLYVIGTMNTADRSIALLDTALRRRFRFVEMMPDTQVIRTEVGANGVVENVDLAKLLEIINRRVELLFDRDHQIGHAYFIGLDSLVDLRDVFLMKVIPLLQEYFYGDWARVCAILGCPFDPEDGKSLTTNSHPLILAKLLSVEDLPGGSGNDFGDRVRCGVNPDFTKAANQGLRPFFDSIISSGNN